MYQRLLADARLLEECGCTVIAIPCNTSHYFADRSRESAYPSHPHDPGDGVRHSGHGGKPPWASWPPTAPSGRGIYQQALEAAGLTPVTLPAQLQRVVMSIIYDEIKKGETGSGRSLGDDAYLARPAVTGAILGCTELSVYRSLHSLPQQLHRLIQLFSACIMVWVSSKD